MLHRGVIIVVSEYVTVFYCDIMVFLFTVSFEVGVEADEGCVIHGVIVAATSCCNGLLKWASAAASWHIAVGLPELLTPVPRVHVVFNEIICNISQKQDGR